MIRAFAIFILALLAFVPLTQSQEKAKGAKDLSPSEVFKQWLEAVAKKDTKTETKLGSKKYPHKFDNVVLFRDQFEGKAKIIHEEISGDRAVVVYRLEPRVVDGVLISYRLNVLVREEGLWRVTREAGDVALKRAP